MAYNNIAHYHGLYGEVNARPSTEYIFSELLETRSVGFNWIIKPHIHSQLYQLFCVQTGQVRFEDASGIHELVAPCLLFIPPTHLHGLVYSPDTTGRILTVADALIDVLFPHQSAVWLTLSTIRRIETFENETAFVEVVAQLIQLDRELFDDKPEKQSMLRAHLTQLWITLYRLVCISETIQQTEQSPTLGYFRRFQQLIRRAEYPKSIPEFADDLAITPVHLNRICQAAVGKSALELVQEHLVKEAKKYLRYTSYSVSEIAFLLKFEYPNYFARLFRKHTGMSPREFREKGK